MNVRYMGMYSLFPFRRKMQCRLYDLTNNTELNVCLLCSFTYTLCGESLMTAEARGQERLLTMLFSNIHILCQYLQRVRVCDRDTDQLSFLLVSDTKELLNINTNEERNGILSVSLMD